MSRASRPLPSFSAGALASSHIVDAALAIRDGGAPRRAIVHHGTRERPARLVALGGGFWQLRLERALLARRGDRVVVRALAPPDTLGGGVILDAHARRQGAGAGVARRLERRARGEAEPESVPAPTPPPRPTPPPAPVPPCERARAGG